MSVKTKRREGEEGASKKRAPPARTTAKCREAKPEREASTENDGTHAHLSTASLDRRKVVCKNCAMTLLYHQDFRSKLTISGRHQPSKQRGGRALVSVTFLLLFLFYFSFLSRVVVLHAIIPVTDFGTVAQYHANLTYSTDHSYWETKPRKCRCFTDTSGGITNTVFHRTLSLGP